MNQLTGIQSKILSELVRAYVRELDKVRSGKVDFFDGMSNVDAAYSNIERYVADSIATGGCASVVTHSAGATA